MPAAFAFYAISPIYMYIIYDNPTQIYFQQAQQRLSNSVKERVPCFSLSLKKKKLLIAMNFTPFINRATLPALQIDAPDFCHAFLCSSLSSYYFRLLTLFSGIFHIYSLFNSKNSLATRTEFLSDCLRNLATLRATHKVQFFFFFLFTW